MLTDPQFFTSTFLEWTPILKEDYYKDFIIKDLQWLTHHHWVKVYAFVLMPDHLHYIWQTHPSLNYNKVKGSHLRVTAQKLKYDLILNREEQLLSSFYVNAKDREYQFWERNPLSVDLYSPNVIYQKLNYIHANPVKANLCSVPEEYLYSSARYYETGQDQFGILTHINEIGRWEREPILVKSVYWDR